MTEEIADNSPVNVLVVDDRAENRLALKAILASPEYHILEAESEREALRHLLYHDCAVILLDVIMPGVDGFELAELIRQRDRAAAVPIIFLTAEAIDAELVRKAYRAGAADYLIKPLLPEMVRAKVAVFAELYRQRQRLREQSYLLLDAERRENAARLREQRLSSQRRYRNLADVVPHIVWSAQTDGRIDYLNRRWQEYTGLPADGRDDAWLQALHPDDRAGYRAAWGGALSSGQGFELVCRLRRADGGYRWQLCRGLPERDEAGAVVAWLGTFTDVDAQKRTEGVLAEFKGTLDAVLDAVLIFDAHADRILYANAGASKLLGYPLAELMTLTPASVLPQLAAEDPYLTLEPLSDQKLTLETTCVRSNGLDLPVELSLQLVGKPEGRIIAIARDITDRKQGEMIRDFLYQKAVDAVQARDEFLSIASHELRTPLTSMSLQLQLFQRYLAGCRKRGETLQQEQVEPKIEQVGQQLARLVRLMDQLLDVSRISGGQFQIEPETADLVELVRDVIGRLGDDAEKAGCQLLLRAEEAVCGEWDTLRIGQVITNLITNACKFGAGKPVEVTVVAEGDRARLTVRDHGIGIAEDAQARIFQRFERAPTEQAFSGLGLGLYIARRIVEAHGGSIGLSSRPGEGAAFTAWLPLAPVTAPAAEDEPALRHA